MLELFTKHKLYKPSPGMPLRREVEMNETTSVPPESALNSSVPGRWGRLCGQRTLVLQVIRAGC